MTERRAAGIGLVLAGAVVGAQLLVGTAWSLSNDDPTVLERMRRCFEREKGVRVEEVIRDPAARAASGGALETVVEGNALTVAVVRDSREADALRAAHAAEGNVVPRLEVRGRYVELWLRDPSPTQRQTAYDCEY